LKIVILLKNVSSKEYYVFQHFLTVYLMETPLKQSGVSIMI